MNNDRLDTILKPWHKLIDDEWGEREDGGTAQKMHESVDEAKSQLLELMGEVIGEDRPYKKYEPCPVCGAQYQYKCSCDEAETTVRNQILERLKQL